MDITGTSRRRVEVDAAPPSSPMLGRAVAAGRPLVGRSGPLAQKAPSPEAVRALSRPSPEAQLRARLDRVMAEMHSPYQVDGREVKVAPHFHSLKGLTDEVIAADVVRIRKAVGPEKFKEIAMSAARATSSRGAAADVRKTVQAMLDAGVHRRYGKVPLEQAIRRMMWDHRIGLDCRGYVGHAFLRSRGDGDKPASAERYGLDPSTFQQPNNAFRKVRIQDARAGDWVHLNPDKGGRDHNVIVRSNATRQLEGARLEVSGKQIPRAFVDDGWPAGTKPTLRVMEVDSAWGGGETGESGGVERRVWVQNEKSGLWGHWSPKGDFRVSAGPYDHELDAVYRPRREP
ncbi:MAG: hypothetical protein IPI67_26925 [Myxococcales bacterium]|nr:hypothetical protein [Myxococcales bacterium]